MLSLIVLWFLTPIGLSGVYTRILSLSLLLLLLEFRVFGFSSPEECIERSSGSYSLATFL
jgi:hypothetical protein